VDADRLWTTTCGKGRWRGDLGGMDVCVRKVQDGEIWHMRADERRSLVEYVRSRYARQVAAQEDVDRPVEGRA